MLLRHGSSGLRVGMGLGEVLRSNPCWDKKVKKEKKYLPIKKILKATRTKFLSFCFI